MAAFPLQLTGQQQLRCSVASRSSRRCACSAVAEPPTRQHSVVRQHSQADGQGLDASTAHNGGMFCIWPRFTPSAPSAYSRTAQVRGETKLLIVAVAVQANHARAATPQQRCAARSGTARTFQARDRSANDALSMPLQAAAPARRQHGQLPPELAILAGGFTDGPVSMQSEQAEGLGSFWRYQGLRM